MAVARRPKEFRKSPGKHSGKPAAEPSDKELWRKVAETVTPLKGRARHPFDPAEPVGGDAGAAGTDNPKTKKAGLHATTMRAATMRPANPAPWTPPPLAGLDRKLTRRIGRGSRPVDAVIDLHGMTQREAHARLLSFLRTGADRGHRLVLVITGKGRPDEGADWWDERVRGVLRKAVPEWLGTPQFRHLVVGYEAAHLHRGGDGAIYVQLRRKTRQGGNG